MLRLTTLTTTFALLASLSVGCLVGVDPLGDETGNPGGGGGGGGGGGAGGGEDFGDDSLLPPGKIAVILAHGLGGNADSFELPIVTAIEAQGHKVLRTTVPGVESVAVRAAALAPQIDAFLAATGATKVHIIAHSMGGLDGRYAISKLGYAGKVASLTTISTPHRGSPLADLALGLTGSSNATQQEALDAILELVGQVDPAALERALHDLAEASAPAFNAANPDAAGVTYRSYAGLSTPNGIDNPNAAAACAAPGATMPAPDALRALLLLSAPIVAEGTARKPADGVVSVASATWTGFAGCISADHLDETSGEAPSFDRPAFYAALAAKLALP